MRFSWRGWPGFPIENDKAERSPQKALKQAADNAAASFDRKLLKAEKDGLQAAQNYPQIAFASDPQMAAGGL
jgi:hypothetical protein